jgi:shikimate dehydrogenase/3-dehydroquinate dehydratase type I
LAKPRTPRIFITLAGPSLAALEAQASRSLGAPVGYELRLDHLQDFTQFEASLHQMLLHLHVPQTIATCRRQEAGGAFKGNVEEQAAVLAAAVRAGCQWVDIEFESIKRVGPALLRELHPARIIASYHNYRRTPSLGAVYRQLARLPVEVVKLATQARHLRNNLQIRQLLKSHHRRSPKLVALAMGAPGIPSRLLALLWGSALTYAAPGDHAVVPGQVAADLMRSLYRVDRLDQRTQLYAVVGSHASISLSPVMQNAAFQAKHANAVFLPCETNQLSDFLAFARQVGFAGFAVTMPYKRGILRSLDWADPLATRIGACNTVAVQRGKWMGWNTDAAAVIEVLTKRLRLSGSRMLILGAGGAARAAAYALRAEGARVIVAARREEMGRRLARAVQGEAVPWQGAEGLEVDAVINATPVGMYPYGDASPLDLARLRARVVFDMVYYPLATRFITEARGRGLITIPGLEMLVAQGARQFEIWTGLTAPRALMEQAVRQVLERSVS